MPFSYPKQFWTWFQRNSHTLLSGQSMKKEEQDYWMREIQMHLRACSKNLSFSLLWKEKDITRFIITSNGRPEYFKMAEKFVAKAPGLKGWDIMALTPPNLLPPSFLQHHLDRVGIDITRCWFVPPIIEGIDQVQLLIYGEVYVDITEEMQQLVAEMVYNILGERVYAIEVGDVCFDSIFNRTEDEKQHELLPLDKLPQYVLPRKRPELFVTAWGKLTDNL